ncbi:non-ribosomal peptide synthetase [Streptacidiphilus cavernicola]|uniref:Amino acid adenylation domain-containing protein n=1 Tax=Streptacidiphilus cavernicola TaxID=3342716 RepID=A0ABV6W670_9ACTN
MPEHRHPTVAQLFAHQAHTAPQRPAVLGAAGERISYGELNRRANRLAHRLRAQGAGPEQVVGVCLPPTGDLLVAVLAVVKSGAAYLPLLPAHPAERRRTALAATGARLVVTTAALAQDGFAADTGTVLTDADADQIAAAPDTDPAVAGHLDQLAYLIHTSGSTGEPKCIAVTHRAIADRVFDVGYTRFGPRDVCLQIAPLSFDGSVWEIWTTLLNGGALALPAPGLPFPDALRDALERHQVTTLSLISPQLQLILTEFPHLLAGLRTLVVGGDVLAPEQARRALTALGGCGRLVHAFGPSESTVFATVEVLDAQNTARPVLPIGSPLPRTTAYVVDQALRRCAPGESGELWLGGPALARGYHRNPAVTAQRFVADPFGAPGGRLYRSGDIVRLRHDGGMEFVGRADDQVKIRGYRIETGEVESALLRHPGVGAAAVVVREDLPAGRGLVGYLVPAPHTTVTDAELRALLADTLPSYMRPAALVRLERLPLNDNGKLDRCALPAPRFGGAGGADDAPRTATETAVHQLWQELLQRPDPGREEDFFDAGGDSLLLVRLFDALQDRFPGTTLTLVDLFEFTTWSSLAAELDLRGRAPADELAGLDV